MSLKLMSLNLMSYNYIDVITEMERISRERRLVEQYYKEKIKRSKTINLGGV